LKLGQAKARAVAFRELGSASLHKVGVAKPPERTKPAPSGKHRPNAPNGLPGVKGDSARRQNRRELGRPGAEFGPVRPDNSRREAITAGGAVLWSRMGS